MNKHTERHSIKELGGRDEVGKDVKEFQEKGRDVRKENIRRKVWNAEVTEGTILRRAKPKPSILEEGSKRVAVYARESTKS